ncbi:cytokine receptor-like factor 2 [Megalobrama amblycephala]|uniref:cytokine receptor-like factor 2 n=1 Tax=Megalobrama amblycephala TaxID=75352 RepID=UPI0020141D80|nr:cytokine receptor-like factor 2 [Megalobrama amblycephala]
MTSWSVYLLVVLALCFAPESSVTEDSDYSGDDELVPMEVFDADQIVFNISNTSHGITLTWRVPNNKITLTCYSTEVQYKSQCVNDWKRTPSEHKQGDDEVYRLNLSTLSIKKNYDFRIRMRLWCNDKDWSNWTKVQSWGNNAGACMVELPANIMYFDYFYILIIVLPLTGFLLVCLLTQQGIKRLILPKVPDPKHFRNKIMDFDQYQWWGNLTQLNEECTTTDIEIIDKNEREEQHQSLVMQPIDTNYEQHDKMYCIYSSETSGENTEPQYSQMVLGYITL